ncbi:MAG: HlyD family efflux transporter periplasmic adaptor subunit [Dysgonamonadaceae bacterium]
MKTDADKIELRSDEIQEILTHPPHSLIRYGISVICSVIVILLSGSFFFKYPDIVSGSTTITSEIPPTWIAAKVSGKIKELYCHDQQVVSEGQLLAVMDNPASTEDVKQLEKLLTATAINDSLVVIPKKLLEYFFDLGELQSAYSAFAKSAVDYQNFKSVNLNLQEKMSVSHQIEGKRVYAYYLREQLNLKRRELNLAKEEFVREKQLYGKGIISKSDLETAEQGYLSAQQALSQLQSSAVSSRIETGQLGESIKKFDLQHRQEGNQSFGNLKSSYHELVAAVKSWKKTYMLISPVNGKVSFVKFWQVNQLVEANGKTFSIIPNSSGRMIGKAILASANSGKIRVGQRVNIKLDNYPYLEYGVLEGRVATISMVPDDEGKYTVSIKLTKGLYTSVGKKLKFTGELSGIAEIMTDNHSLGERLIAPMYTLIKEKIDW